MKKFIEFFRSFYNFAAGRHYVTFAAGILTPLLLLGVVDDAQRAELLAALNQFGDALEALFGASKRVFAAVTPIALGVMAFLAGKKSTLETLLGLIQQKNDTASAKDQVTMIASPEMVEKVGESATLISKDQAMVVASPEVAKANPSPNVMSSADVKVVPASLAPNVMAIQPQ